MTGGKLAIFTICSNNYLPMAKVFFTSVARFCPEAMLFLCLADERSAHAEDYPAGVNVVTAEELPIPDFRAFAFRYSIMEFNTALKPFMFRYLLEARFTAMLYFDPDIEVFAPLDVVLDPLRGGQSFVLTPHICYPAEGDTFPDDIGVMRAGIYNLGFLGVGEGPDTERLLRWWSRRLRYECISEQDRGIFVDQKFMDLIPGFADYVCIVRDPTCNVAYWNLLQRALTRSGDCWLIDGQALRFFHFSGISIDDLSHLSKWTLAFRGDEISPELHALMRHYAGQVKANDFASGVVPPYRYGYFASGTKIPEQVRRMFRERHMCWMGDPFETYEAFLRLPAADQWAGSSAVMITNLMDDLRRRDPSLMSRFDPATPEGVEGYTRWFVENAAALLTEPKLVRPVADRLARLDR